jgi:hypothetical protein
MHLVIASPVLNILTWITKREIGKQTAHCPIQCKKRIGHISSKQGLHLEASLVNTIRANRGPSKELRDKKEKINFLSCRWGSMEGNQGHKGSKEVSWGQLRSVGVNRGQLG